MHRFAERRTGPRRATLIMRWLIRGSERLTRTETASVARTRWGVVQIERHIERSIAWRAAAPPSSASGPLSRTTAQPLLRKWAAAKLAYETHRTVGDALEQGTREAFKAFAETK